MTDIANQSVDLKIFKAGNSDAIRLTKPIKDALNVATGDHLEASFDEKTGAVMLVKKQEGTGVGDEFLKLYEQAHAQYKEALDRLKDL